MTVSFGRLSAAARRQGPQKDRAGILCRASRGQRRGSRPHGGVDGRGGTAGKAAAPGAAGRSSGALFVRALNVFHTQKAGGRKHLSPAAALPARYAAPHIPACGRPQSGLGFPHGKQDGIPLHAKSGASLYMQAAGQRASVPVYLAMEAILPRALGPAMYGNYSLPPTFSSSCSCSWNWARPPASTMPCPAPVRNGALSASTCGSALLIAVISHAHRRCHAGAPRRQLAHARRAPVAGASGRHLGLSDLVGPRAPFMNDAVGAPPCSPRWCAPCLALGRFLPLIGLFLLDWAEHLQPFRPAVRHAGVTALATGSSHRRHWERCYGGPDATFLPAPERRQQQGLLHEFFTYSPIRSSSRPCSSSSWPARKRWLLQWFDGQRRSRLFRPGAQGLVLACLKFVSAMTAAGHRRELSIAWGQRDHPAHGPPGQPLRPLSYAVAAYSACFSMAEGRRWCASSGRGSSRPPSCPCRSWPLYPLHHSYLQLASSVSTPRAVPANCATHPAGMRLRMTTAWFLLAPEAYGGPASGGRGPVHQDHRRAVRDRQYLPLARLALRKPIRLLPIMLHEILVRAGEAARWPLPGRELTRQCWGLGGIDSRCAFTGFSASSYTLAAALTGPCSSLTLRG